MATNSTRFVKNVFGAGGPLIMKGLFQAGGTQAIKRGEILELSSSNWIPLDADQSMTAVIAIANEEIKAGDRAGYYEIIVPRPGDVFQFELSAASNPSVGAALYWVSSETVTTSGNNILGYVVGDEHYPDYQGHLSDDASGDAGTTIRSTTAILMSITQASSYYAALFV